VFGLDDYELITDSDGAGGAGHGGSGTGAGAGATGGSGNQAGGGSGGEAVALDDCCIDERPPDGWEYTVVSRRGGAQAPPMECVGSGATPRVFLSGKPGPATCGGQCGCGDPEGESCTQELVCFSDPDCGGFSITTVGPCDGVIHGIFLSESCRYAVDTVPAKCAEITGVAVPPWQYKHIACPDESETDDTGECAPGQHCATGAVGAQACIWRLGVHDCPTEGGFVKSVDVFDEQDIIDDRDCGGCICNTADTDCINHSFQTGDGFSCGPTSTTTGCSNTGSISRAGIKNVATPSVVGACAPSGTPSPAGAITSEVASTLCCRNVFEE